MIEETYAVFERWDFGSRSARTSIGYGGELHRRPQRDVAARRREGAEPALRPDGRDRPLVLLAKGGCQLDEWKPLLLWHMTRDEFLVRDFLENWLFPAFEAARTASA